MKSLNEQGVKDALAALAAVRKATLNIERRAEQKAGEAEEELLTARKVRGYVDIEIEKQRAALRAIEDAKS